MSERFDHHFNTNFIVRQLLDSMYESIDVNL